MFTIYSTVLRKVLIESRACCRDQAVTGTEYGFCARETTGEGGTWAKGLIDASLGGAAGGPASSCSCRSPCSSSECSSLRGWLRPNCKRPPPARRRRLACRG